MAIRSPYETTAARGVPTRLATDEAPTRLPRAPLGPVTSTVAPPLAPPTNTPLQQLGPGPTPITPQQPTSTLRPMPETIVHNPTNPTPQTPAPTGPVKNPASAVPMGFGGINFTPYGPGNTLRNQQITPTGLGGVGGQVSQQATRARELAAADLEGLGGPDRAQIASDTLRRLIADTEPAFQQELRGVGQRASALGRLGSGMTTSDLGDGSQRRNQAITSEAGRLASEAAGQTLADRMDVFGARSGASSQWGGDDLARESQAFNQGQGIRNEYRGERDFQDYMANQATDDQVRQMLLEDQMLNSSFNRDQSRLGSLSTGFGNVPDDAYRSAADSYGNQAQGNLDTVAQLAALYGNRRRTA